MDVEMDDGHESDYPEPSFSHNSPYPALPRVNGVYPTESGTTASHLSHVPNASSQEEPLLAEAMRSYSEQAQSWWSRQSTFGFGSSTPKRRQTDGNITADESDNESTHPGAPMANAFFRPYAGLDSYFSSARRSASASVDGEDVPTELLNAEDNQIQYEPPRSQGRRGRGRGRPKGSRGYKGILKRLEERNPALREPKPEKRPRGRGRGKGRGRGPGRPRGNGRPVDPGAEFKEAQGLATQAFLEQDYDRAMLHALQAIQANPEVFQAHSLYAEILTCVGRENDAVAALMIGAIPHKEAGPWLTAGQRTLDLAESPRPKEILDQALYCFTSAKNCEADNYEARAGMLECFLELGNAVGARSQSRSMLRLRPRDVLNVRQFAELCADTGDTYEFNKAKAAYDEAFKLYADEESFGDPAEQWSHLNVYTELVDRVGVKAEDVTQLRRLARWFLGRKDETFWDRYDEDDREFDSGNERRAYVGEFQQGRASRDRDQYGDGLPLEIRVKLGIFRLKLGMPFHEEALKHLNLLLQWTDQVEVYYDIFFLVAERLRKARLYKEAIKFYEPVERLPEVINDEFLMGAAECYCQDGQYEEAEAHYLEIIENNSDHVTSRITLAKMYMDLEDREKAKPLLKEVIKLGHKDLLRKEKLPTYEAQKEMKQARRKAELQAELEAMWEDDPTVERVELADMPLAHIQREIRKAQRRAEQEAEFLDPHFDRMVLSDFVPAGEGSFQHFDINPPTVGLRRRPVGARPSLDHASDGVHTDDDEYVDDGEADEDTDDDEDEDDSDNDDVDDSDDANADEVGKLDADGHPKGSVSKAYKDAHPEIDWVHRGGGRYKRRSDVPADQLRKKKPPKASRSGGDPTGKTTTFRPRLAGRNRERIRLLGEQEPSVQKEYGFVKELWATVDEGDDDEAMAEWAEHAEIMTAAFRAMDVFYTDRLYREFTGYGGTTIDDVVGTRKPLGEAQAMLNRLEDDTEGRATPAEPPEKPDTVPRHFHDISFTQWHRVFVDLALVYAKRGEQDKCYDILSQALLRSNVFIHDAELHNTSLAACICCGIIFNDSGFVTDVARRYITISDTRAGMPFQLLAAVNRLCHNGNWFNAGPTQKFMLRSVKTFDHIMMPDAIRRKVKWGGQGEGLQRRLEKLGQGNGTLDAGVLTIYGHMVAEANFSHSALPYYFRAYALQPANPGLNLAIAAVLIQSAMKRQTDNRQYGVHQALSFLYRYYELRTASGRAAPVQEAEYNMARAWHLLGLTHLALSLIHISEPTRPY